MKKYCIFNISISLICLGFTAGNSAENKSSQKLFFPSSLAILPEDGRTIFFEAFAAAQKLIRIEICVLEDPLILQSLNDAIVRGVQVKVNVDRGKYLELADERYNLAEYVTSAGGQLHLSNPIFPRSFPKIILIDDSYLMIGSACLDSTTFMEYRDYIYVSDDCGLINQMAKLFDNDWHFSANPGQSTPLFNPTPIITQPTVIIAPVNSAEKLVSFIQKAKKTLDVTSELLGNPTLESELSMAVARGVRVRLIAPQIVNGATFEEQDLQTISLENLKDAGINVHVTLSPANAIYPYMHARTAIADNKYAYLGSISLSLDSSTFNREAGLILNCKKTVKKMEAQFEIDFNNKSVSQ